jgi:hypothetical protein
LGLDLKLYVLFAVLDLQTPEEAFVYVAMTRLMARRLANR